MRSVLGGGEQARSTANEDLAAPENGHDDADADKNSRVALVGHAIPGELVVALIGRRALIEGTDAAHGSSYSKNHNDEADKVANAEEPVADGANVSWPEEAGAECENQEVDGHDDAPGCVPGPDERPAGTCLVA